MATRQDFAVALLQKLGYKPTAANVKAIVGWEAAEGGNWNNDAKFNPLNTTQPAAGAGNTGSQGNIKVYKDWAQGVDATAETLKNGRYDSVLAALAKGTDAGAVAKAVGSSPWGTNAALIAKTIGVAPSSTAASPLPGGSSPSSAPVASEASADPQARKLAILNYLVNQHKPGALTDLVSGIQSAGVAASSPATSSPSSPSSGSGPSGLGTFDGKKVAAWIVPVLTAARAQGWKGTVVSGYRTDADQTRIYNSGVRPAAKPISEGGSGSNHERTGFLQGAVDVTDAPTLAKILKAKGSRLQWAGPKGDEPHFSVPGKDGSY